MQMRAHPEITERPTLQGAASLLAANELPCVDLTDAHLKHFFCAGSPEAPTGIVGLELCGSAALLRSLAVGNSARNAGLGSALVAHAEAYARAQGARAMYLLTTTAEEFFAGRGYVRVDRQHAPAGIRATREFADICPASSAFMVKQL
jgi:amino-acid N-acetyltransferase